MPKKPIEEVATPSNLPPTTAERLDRLAMRALIYFGIDRSIASKYRSRLEFGIKGNRALINVHNLIKERWYDTEVETNFETLGKLLEGKVASPVYKSVKKDIESNLYSLIASEEELKSVLDEMDEVAIDASLERINLDLFSAFREHDADALKKVKKDIDQSFRSTFAPLTPEQRTQNIMEDIMAFNSKPSPFGIPFIDNMTGGGLRPGQMLGIIATSNTGKTHLAIELAYRLIDTVGFVYITLDEQISTIMVRLINKMTGRGKGFIEQNIDMFKKEITDINKKAAIIDKGRNISELETVIKYYTEDAPENERTTMFVLDHFHLMKLSSYKDDVSAQSENINAIKALAHDYKATFIILSQVAKGDRRSYEDMTAKGTGDFISNVDYAIGLIPSDDETKAQFRFASGEEFPDDSLEEGVSGVLGIKLKTRDASNIFHKYFYVERDFRSSVKHTFHDAVRVTKKMPQN